MVPICAAACLAWAARNLAGCSGSILLGRNTGIALGSGQKGRAVGTGGNVWGSRLAGHENKVVKISPLITARCIVIFICAYFNIRYNRFTNTTQSCSGRLFSILGGFPKE